MLPKHLPVIDPIPITITPGNSIDAPKPSSLSKSNPFAADKTRVEPQPYEMSKSEADEKSEAEEKEVGSYTNTYESGKKYHGKGDKKKDG